MERTESKARAVPADETDKDVMNTPYTSSRRTPLPALKSFLAFSII